MFQVPIQSYVKGHGVDNFPLTVFGNFFARAISLSIPPDFLSGDLI